MVARCSGGIGSTATSAGTTGSEAIAGTAGTAGTADTADEAPVPSIAISWAGTIGGLRPGESPLASLSWRRRFLRIVEFHRFLMALSVRPGINLTIFDHLVP